MIMCVLLCYPVFIHMSQLLSTGRPISSFCFLCVWRGGGGGGGSFCFYNFSFVSYILNIFPAIADLGP